MPGCSVEREIVGSTAQYRLSGKFEGACAWDLAGRIELEPDPALGRLDARIEIETAGGDRLSSHWRGEAASYAWSWPEIVSWARALGGEFSPSHLRATERVIDAVERIDDAPCVGHLASATVTER